MNSISRLAVSAALGLIAAPALAEPAFPDGSELPAYLECVPYAREVTGIQIYGDAYTWWGQAAGRYRRGHVPQAGAVMAFQPAGNMRLGHVAAVSRVIDSRTVLLRHANWSPIDGRRGQIEDDVRAVDVSPGNDWSEVRVWYDPIDDLGTTAWPVAGFIYPSGDNTPALAPVRTAAVLPKAKRVKPSRDFMAAFTSVSAAKKTPSARKHAKKLPRTERAPVDLLSQLGG